MTAPCTEDLAPTAVVDSTHPEVVAFTRARTEGASGELDAALKLYFAVRDEFRYDPYGVGSDAESLKASHTLAIGRSWCVGKAVLLAACYRAHGIPARLGFADVKNHMSTERMREHMQTDVFYWHGYTVAFLEGKWVKATPAFNIGLCEKFGILPLDFDGRNDSIYHPFDAEGKRHMEYLRDRGEFPDVPIDDMHATWAEHYPSHLTDAVAGAIEGDFEREVEEEVAGR
jgi:transglutaminase-like putative cysteine protease